MRSIYSCSLHRLLSIAAVYFHVNEEYLLNEDIIPPPGASVHIRMISAQRKECGATLVWTAP